MNVNGVTSVDAYSAYTQGQSINNETVAPEKTIDETAAVYERTSTDEEVKEASEKKTYTPNAELIEKMKADVEARTEQLRSLVEKIILQQADKTTSIFDFLGKEYSPEEIAQAKEDVSEDGYFGVKQTSQRILDFANALTGGDPEKIETMREAFKQGYEQAKKTWGDELPEICQQTYDAVMDGFDEQARAAGLQ